MKFNKKTLTEELGEFKSDKKTFTKNAKQKIVMTEKQLDRLLNIMTEDSDWQKSLHYNKNHSKLRGVINKTINESQLIMEKEGCGDAEGDSCSWWEVHNNGGGKSHCGTKSSTSGGHCRCSGDGGSGCSKVGPSDRPPKGVYGVEIKGKYFSLATGKEKIKKMNESHLLNEEMTCAQKYTACIQMSGNYGPQVDVCQSNWETCSGLPSSGRAIRGIINKTINESQELKEAEICITVDDCYYDNAVSCTDGACVYDDTTDWNTRKLPKNFEDIPGHGKPGQKQMGGDESCKDVLCPEGTECQKGICVGDMGMSKTRGRMYNESRLLKTTKTINESEIDKMKNMFNRLGTTGRNYNPARD